MAGVQRHVLWTVGPTLANSSLEQEVVARFAACWIVHTPRSVEHGADTLSGENGS